MDWSAGFGLGVFCHPSPPPFIYAAIIRRTVKQERERRGEGRLLIVDLNKAMLRKAGGCASASRGGSEKHTTKAD